MPDIKKNTKIIKYISIIGKIKINKKMEIHRILSDVQGWTWQRHSTDSREKSGPLRGIQLQVPFFKKQFSQFWRSRDWAWRPRDWAESPKGTIQRKEGQFCFSLRKNISSRSSAKQIWVLCFLTGSAFHWDCSPRKPLHSGDEEPETQEV